MANTKPHVVLLPSPGIGHLVPLTELAKRLVFRHGLTATVITFSDLSSHVQQSLLSSLPTGISSVSIPPIPLDDLPATANIVTRLSHMLARSVPFIRSILLDLRERNAHIAAYIIDLFGGDTISVAAELGIPQYIFFTSNFFYLSFVLNLPALSNGPDVTADKPLNLPGCVPLLPKDFTPSASDRKSEVFAWMLRHAEHHNKVDGIMVNSFEALEGPATKFLRTRGNGEPPIYPVGPLTSDGGGVERRDEHEYMNWLDEQPDRSVLFVTFGSGGTLSFEQTREMALGLETSGQRFLWVVRAPSGGESGAKYFSAVQEKNGPLWFLPEGFVERTKGRGMLVASWASQGRILAHEATGGFLSHCGWNSTLESIVNGVPMIAWPLYAEQRMNALMLVEAVKVALRPAAEDEAVVGREEIAEMVRNLMEGEGGKEVRKRMREMKAAALEDIGVGGCSSNALTNLVNVWKATA